MSLKANKWGPVVTVPTESTPPALLPTDIAAAIAAGLSIRLGNQGSVTSLAPQQSLTAEFEINDSTVSTLYMCMLLSAAVLNPSPTAISWNTNSPILVSFRRHP